jgi:hypothetical protein
VAGIAVVAVLVPSLATGDTIPPGATVDTVFIRDGHAGLRFVAPDTVQVGDYLNIVNQTRPHRVGPHTFALVTKSSIPRTRRARHACFHQGHICRKIAGWLGFGRHNPATAGAPGWDTLGSLTNKGDAWFTTQKPNTSFAQRVSSNPSSGPTTLFFMCAIHPFMHGSIEVLPAGP